MTGIILAGGKGSRLGGVDKAFLQLGGMPLLERVLSAITEVCDDIIVVSRNPGDFLRYGVRSVEDLVEGTGPLGGLYTGLMASHSPVNFVTACDMPFLNSRFIQYMVNRFDSTDVLIPRVNGYVEPLHALYARSCIPAIEEKLKAGRRKLNSYFDQVTVTYIEKHEITPFDPDLRMFANINSAGDIRAAERIHGNEPPHS